MKTIIPFQEATMQSRVTAPAAPSAAVVHFYFLENLHQLKNISLHSIKRTVFICSVDAAFAEKCTTPFHRESERVCVRARPLARFVCH